LLAVSSGEDHTLLGSSGEDHTLLGKTVYIRSFDHFLPVTAQLGTQVINYDKQNIRLLVLTSGCRK